MLISRPEIVYVCPLILARNSQVSADQPISFNLTNLSILSQTMATVSTRDNLDLEYFDLMKYDATNTCVQVKTFWKTWQPPSSK